MQGFGVQPVERPTLTLDGKHDYERQDMSNKA
jgi:hypothetical protein